MLNGKFKVKESFCVGVEDGDVLNFVNGYSKEWFEGGEPADKNLVVSMEDFNARYSTQIEPCPLTLKEEFLTIGRVAEFRDGEMGFVLPDRIITEDGFYLLKELTDDLKDSDGVEDCDIVEIFDAPVKNGRAWNFGWAQWHGANDLLISVWKRQEKTHKQLEIERIESEMRRLADDLQKLKSE